MAELEEPDTTVIKGTSGDDGWEDVVVEDATSARGIAKGVLATSVSNASSVRFL